jgi:hypothetical protein
MCTYKFWYTLERYVVELCNANVTLNGVKASESMEGENTMKHQDGM